MELSDSPTDHETSPAAQTVTELLIDWRSGDDDALERLVPLVYDELKRLAQRNMRRERPGQTLSATALVHESFLRLVDAEVDWKDRAHFLAVSARMMRRILIDRSRAKKRLKRGGGEHLQSLEDLQIEVAADEQEVDVAGLEEAIVALAELDERKAKVIELTFFGGLSYEEIGEVLGLSRATVHRDLTMAKAWLFSRLTAGGT